MEATKQAASPCGKPTLLGGAIALSMAEPRPPDGEFFLFMPLPLVPDLPWRI
jgi:hypothetical protein